MLSSAARVLKEMFTAITASASSVSASANGYETIPSKNEETTSTATPQLAALSRSEVGTGYQQQDESAHAQPPSGFRPY
jgi:hypothetical protein